MFAQADYSPNSSPEAISRVNSFINRAYNQLALEAPFLFFETEVTMAVEPDVTSGAGSGVLTDRVKLAGTNTLPRSPTGHDPWTWKTTYTATQATATNTTGLTVWKYDRSWDGRIIEITAEDGTLVRNQIRSVWLASDIYHMTFVRPWDTTTYPDTSYDGFTYKILTESYPLPDNLIELKSARLRDKSNNFPLDVIGQQQAEQLQLISPSTNVTSGIPRTIFRRGHQRLQGPSVPPVVELGTGLVAGPALDNAWLGPEPPGSFQYKVTYTWGKRDTEFQLPGLGHWEGMASGYLNTGQAFPGSVEDETDTNGSLASRNRYREPWIESPPSPSSEVITTEMQSVQKTVDGVPAIRISLPNIEYALGFLNTVTSGASTYTRQSLMQSGLYVRIYRKRIATDFYKYGELSQRVENLNRSQLDAAEDYYLLAETRIDTSNNGWFFDNGEIIPDYNRRLRDIHGYQTIAFYPRPDQRYPISIRCITRPTELRDDDDTPLIHAEAMDILIERAMSFFYENLGNPQMSMASRAKYQAELQTLSNRYGDLRPASVPVLRRMTRARGSSRTNRKWNKRLTDSDLGWDI